MRRARIAGLWLFATFALAATVTAAASAQAPPGYSMCEKAPKTETKPKHYTGAYSNSQCTKAVATHEGEYEAKAVPTPFAFTEGKSKASSFYYYGQHGEGILWEVQCKKAQDQGVIASPTEGALRIVFERCQVTDELTRAKATKCPSSITASVESSVVEAYPGKEAAVIFYPGFNRAFECGSVKVAKDAGFQIGRAQETSKGPAAVFAADTATGEPEIHEYFAEGGPEGSFLYGEVNDSGPLDVVLETTQPLGPKNVVLG